jgi:hypothetical protein
MLEAKERINEGNGLPALVGYEAVSVGQLLTMCKLLKIFALQKS